MVLSRIKTWEELTIQDNFLFQKVMQNKRICKHLIECILQIKIQEIHFPATEKPIAIGYLNKSVRLDVYVKDESGRVFDIEMQCTNGSDDELPKRTRYYQSMIDMEILDKGKSYKELKPSYIIFICTFDPFHEELPMYTFRHRCVEKEGLELGDQSTKLFLNCKGNTDHLHPDIAAFLRYVDGKAPKGSFTEEIDKEVVRVKEQDEMRREYMTLAMELKNREEEGLKKGILLGREQGLVQGLAQGTSQANQITVRNLLDMHLPIDTIAQIIGQTPQYVQDIIKKSQGTM